MEQHWEQDAQAFQALYQEPYNTSVSSGQAQEEQHLQITCGTKALQTHYCHD